MSAKTSKQQPRSQQAAQGFNAGHNALCAALSGKLGRRLTSVETEMLSVMDPGMVCAPGMFTYARQNPGAIGKMLPMSVFHGTQGQPYLQAMVEQDATDKDKMWVQCVRNTQTGQSVFFDMMNPSLNAIRLGN